MAAHFEALFPNLQRTTYEVKSPRDQRYNCVAWAAGETHRWWWPIHAYWPTGVSSEETVEAFVQAFQSLGYGACESARPESNCEKIAIYADASGTPTHVARQIDNGNWTSKLGSLEDIEHADLQGLEDHPSRGDYGRVVRILKRGRD